MYRQVVVGVTKASPAQTPASSQLTPTPPAVAAVMLLVLQRLDLSTPIKNPRRDFSNGFLAAEMMARFYVSALPF